MLVRVTSILLELSTGMGRGEWEQAKASWKTYEQIFKNRTNKSHLKGQMGEWVFIREQR